MSDPIAELVAALRAGRAPPLAWVTRWSAGGREPVQAAWEASVDGAALLALTHLAGALGLGAGLRLGGDAAYVRRRYPRPPTLQDLLARGDDDARR